MIKKYGSSEIVDACIADILKKEGSKGDDFVDVISSIPRVVGDFFSDFLPKADEALVPITETGGGGMKGGPPRVPPSPTDTPPPKTPGGTPGTGQLARQLSTSGEEFLRFAEFVIKNTEELNLAILQVIRNKNTVVSAGKFKGKTLDELNVMSKNLMSEEAIPALIKKLRDLSSSYPDANKTLRSLESVYSELSESRAGLLQYISNLGRSSAKTTEEAASGAAKTTGPAASSAGRAGADTAQEASSSFIRKVNEIVKNILTRLKEVFGSVSERTKVFIQRIMEKASTIGFMRKSAETIDNAEEVTTAKKIVDDLEADLAGDINKAAGETSDPKKAKEVINEGVKQAKETGSTNAKTGFDPSAPSGAGGGRGKPPGKGPGKPGNGAKKNEGLISWVKMILGLKENTAVAKLLSKGLSIAFFIGLYYFFVAPYFESSEGQKNLAELDNRINKALVALSKIKFVQGSFGEEDTSDLITSLREVKSEIVKSKKARTEQEWVAFGEDLDELLKDSTEYVDDKDVNLKFIIKNRDEWAQNWEEAITSVQEVADYIPVIAEGLVLAAEKARSQAGETQGDTENAITGLVGKEQEGSSLSENVLKPGEFTTEVNNVTLDYANAPLQSMGFRSAVPRMIRKIFSKPAGLAFIDPEGAVWTGAISRDTRKPTEKDYWRALGFLYNNGIFTANQLKRYMRNNLAKGSRRRFSAWREALRHYRKNRRSYSSNKYLNKFEKYANLSNDSVTSINKEIITMKKLADSIADSYVQDATKGLSDEYAKSYFTGLNSMYDERLGSSDDNFKGLYQPNGGTGSELIGAAHSQSLEIADAMGKGALVENQVEQQNASRDVAFSRPTGNFRHKHANVVESLIKLANKADESGNIQISDLIDKAIKEIIQN